MSFMDSGGGDQLPPWLQQQGVNNPWLARMQNMLRALRGGGAPHANVTDPATGTAGTDIAPQMMQGDSQMNNPYNPAMQQMQQLQNTPIAPTVAPPGAPPPAPVGTMAPTLGPTLGGNNTPVQSGLDAGTGLFSPTPYGGFGGPGGSFLSGAGGGGYGGT